MRNMRTGVSDGMKTKKPKKWDPVWKIVLAVALLVLCFFRKRLIPQDHAALMALGTGLTIACICLSFYWIITAISQLSLQGENKTTAPSKLPSEPLKCLTPQELFDFLENEDIIDVIIDNGEQLRVGTSSDSRSGRYKQTTYFDKHYYINEKEYVNFSEFQTRFLDELKGDVVKILYAGIEDMLVKI